jgi:FMN phosphatase YigB (HAD superfamily)
MGLTDYRALLIDCDEVLVDRDSGVWTALQPMLANQPGLPEKAQILAEYHAAVGGLYSRFDELGFSGLLCFAHRQVAERLGLKASWEEGMSFARSVPNWTLFEDAPGAMLYLRKFYHLLVVVDRDLEDRGQLCERLGLESENILSVVGNPTERAGLLGTLEIDATQLLRLSRAPAQALGGGGLCLIRRGRAEHQQPCAADFCINSMADLVRQHQLSLRR